MADTSGSLGGDDSSKLDELMAKIQGNSAALESLTRLISKIEDASGKQETSIEDFLANIEKLVSKKDVETAAKKAVGKQADLDRLAANNFRATETIVAEVLSRMGGTSFYPVLSAFRVARESVAAAQNKPQNEIDVLDIFKFVNEASMDLMDQTLDTYLSKVLDIEEIRKNSIVDSIMSIFDLLKNKSTEAAKSVAKAATKSPEVPGAKSEDLEIVDSPNESSDDGDYPSEDIPSRIQEIIDQVMELPKDWVSVLDDAKEKTLGDYQDKLDQALNGLNIPIEEAYQQYNEILQEIKDNFIDLSEDLIAQIEEINEDILNEVQNQLAEVDKPKIPSAPKDEVTDPIVEDLGDKDLQEDDDQEDVKVEADSGGMGGSGGNNNNVVDAPEDPEDDGEDPIDSFDPESVEATAEAIAAMSSAKTAAAIAGLGVPIVLLIGKFQSLAQTVGKAEDEFSKSLTSLTRSPYGSDSPAQDLLSPIDELTNALPDLGAIIGTSAGTVMFGPLGGLIGYAVGSGIGSSLAFPIQTVIDILISVDKGISQISKDLVGFSEETTMSLIERDLALLEDDIRRANQIGEEVGAVTDAQTRLQLASRQAFDNLAEAAEPLLVGLLTIAAQGLESLNTIIGALKFVNDVMPQLDQINFQTNNSLPEILKSVQDLLNFLTNQPVQNLDSLVNQSQMTIFRNNPTAAVQLMRP